MLVPGYFFAASSGSWVAGGTVEAAVSPMDISGCLE